MDRKTKIISFYRVLKTMFYNHIIAPKKFSDVEKSFSKYNILSIDDTAKVLANTNRSIGRFGDGEISWIFQRKNNIQDFEKVSPKLSKRLLEVLNNSDDDFMISLPDTFRNLNHLTSTPRKFWTMYLIENKSRINSILDANKTYYNTNITRPYIDYNFSNMAKTTFKTLKTVWDNKNILIIEGNETRLGFKNDLFNNANDIKRIECPSTNAFESYEDILYSSKEFLNTHSDYISLISLGPTATILSYDLFKSGYRAIDIGHIDIEYEWYLMGAKERVDLPYKYVNEVIDGGHATKSVTDGYYLSEIIKKIE